MVKALPPAILLIISAIFGNGSVTSSPCHLGQSVWGVESLESSSPSYCCYNGFCYSTTEDFNITKLVLSSKSESFLKNYEESLKSSRSKRDTEDVKSKCKECFPEEIAVCRSKKRLLFPLSAISVIQGKRVGVIQAPPHFVQPVIYNECVDKQCRILGGKCKQLFIPQPLYTIREVDEVDVAYYDLVYLEHGCECQPDRLPASEEIGHLTDDYLTKFIRQLWSMTSNGTKPLAMPPKFDYKLEHSSLKSNKTKSKKKCDESDVLDSEKVRSSTAKNVGCKEQNDLDDVVSVQDKQSGFNETTPANGISEKGVSTTDGVATFNGVTESNVTLQKEENTEDYNSLTPPIAAPQAQEVYNNSESVREAPDKLHPEIVDITNNELQPKVLSFVSEKSEIAHSFADGIIEKPMELATPRPTSEDEIGTSISASSERSLIPVQTAVEETVSNNSTPLVISTSPKPTRRRVGRLGLPTLTPRVTRATSERPTAPPLVDRIPNVKEKRPIIEVPNEPGVFSFPKMALTLSNSY